MKQSFKIGKIFSLIIVSVCVFFNYEMGFCGGKPGASNGLTSSQVKDDNDNGIIIFPPNADEDPNFKLATVIRNMNEIQTRLKQQDDEIARLKTGLSVQQAESATDRQSKKMATLRSELKQHVEEVTEFKDKISNQQVAMSKQIEDIADQQASEMIKLKNELEQQVKEVAKLKNEINNQQVAMNQQAENVANQQNDVAAKLQAELNMRLEVAQQQLEDMQSQLNEITNSQSKTTVTPKVIQTKTAVVKYFPIDISGGIFDSTFVAMKNVDNFNMESEYLNVKVGFNYNIYLKKDEGDDFNKYIILNPKFFGVDNVYFSIFNYHNFLKNKHTNSEDFKKNYYTLYAKSIIDEINSVYFGGSVGYIPFKSVIDDSDKNFKKYMLFVSLNTDFDLMLFNNSLHFSNFLTVDFNLLRSDYLVNSNKSNEYIKMKDAILLNYEINGLTGLFAGIDFGVYTMHRQFRKNIGLNKNTECNLIAGIKFEFGSINISLGNRGVGLGLSMNY